MRLADVCNPHVKDEHPLSRAASGFVVPGGPGSHRRTVRTRRDRPLRPNLHRPRRSFRPTGACRGVRSFDASVTDRISRSSKARSTRPAKTASTATQRDGQRLSRSETPSIARGTLLGPFPGTPPFLAVRPRWRFPPGTGSRSRFRPRVGLPLETRSRPRPQPQPGCAS